MEAPLFEILTVCTGNICRSPLAALLLSEALAEFSPVVTSAGTHGLRDAPMTLPAQRLAEEAGVPAEAAASHRSRYLTEALLVSPDLILTMTREHRRDVALLAPSRLRSTFTIREFARLAAGLHDSDWTAAARAGGDDPRARLRALTHALAARRGIAPAPKPASDDDVIDPYRRSWRVYRQSAAELEPATAAVAAAVREVLGKP